MTSFRSYFRYHLKSRIGYTVTTALLGFLITFISLLDEYNGKVTDTEDSLFFLPAVVLSIVAVLSAILEFVPFMNRRNLDALYSLPIDRRQMYLVHYITGFLSTLIAHTVSFFLVLFFWLPHHEYFALGYAIPLYFISIPCGFIMYAITVFLYTRGNTDADGSITVALGGCSLFVISSALIELFNLRKPLIGIFNSTSTFFWSPINDFTTAYQKMIDMDTYRINGTLRPYTLEEFYTNGETLSMIVIFLAIGIAATVGFFLTYHKKRVETIGEITNSWFSYRVMIPLYGFSLIIILNDVFWLVLSLALMIVGYVVYRRTYRLKRSDLIVLAAYVCYGLLALSL